jgi:hypothetical protein
MKLASPLGLSVDSLTEVQNHLDWEHAFSMGIILRDGGKQLVADLINNVGLKIHRQVDDVLATAAYCRYLIGSLVVVSVIYIMFSQVST